MKKVCTIGSATQDIFLLYEGAETTHLHTVDQQGTYLLLPEGAKIDIPKIKYSSGGGAVNVAMGLTKLGHSVEAFFKTGNDQFGKQIKEDLAAKNIGSTYCLVDATHSTAVSVIVPSRTQDHAALCYRGANRYLSSREFPGDILNEIDLLFLGPLGGSSTALISDIAPRAMKAGVVVACNPSAQQLQEDAAFVEALGSIDILILNRRESGFLMGALIKSPEPLQQIRGNQMRWLLQPYLRSTKEGYSFKEVAQKTLNAGPSLLVVTNGSEGVYVATKEHIYFHPSIPIKHAYSLGAGDGFSSAFLGGFIHGLTLEDAIRFGCINGASVAQYADAHQGLFTLSELEQHARLLPKESLQIFQQN